MVEGFAQRVDEAYRSVAGLAAAPISAAVILGSGLGAYAERFGGTRVEYGSIRGFPLPSVQGHRGVLHIGGGIALFAGRFHHYEGLRPEDVVMPVFLARKLGARTMVLTNACGAVSRSLRPGELVLIRDHINLMGMNPLRGPNPAELGPRFPDMSEVYPRSLRDLARRAAGASMPEGVYAALAGPSYETPAEIRMLAAIGADLVGMSTVPEAIAASYLGMGVLGISCVTNMAAGILETPLRHEEVLETGRLVAPRLERLLDALLPELSA